MTNNIVIEPLDEIPDDATGVPPWILGSPDLDTEMGHNALLEQVGNGNGNNGGTVATDIPSDDYIRELGDKILSLEPHQIRELKGYIDERTK